MAFKPMDKARMGEIALMHLKHTVKKDGLRLEDVPRRVGQEAKELGISSEEMMSFAHTLSQEMIDEAFASKK